MGSLWIRHWSNELSERFPLKKEEPAAVVTPGDRLGHRNVRRPDLEVAVRSLPANERLLFLLRDVEGYTPAAIARLLDIPEAQVQRACFSARIRLCQVLAERPAPKLPDRTYRLLLNPPPGAPTFLDRLSARPSASASSGTSSVMHDPAAT